MIGDHLQLQPSIMQKFAFERTPTTCARVLLLAARMNNVNISMFERLIRAPEDHKAPSSVLAVQRRMRKDVCDLTRETPGFKIGRSTCPIFLEPYVSDGFSRPSPHMFPWPHSTDSIVCLPPNAVSLRLHLIQGTTWTSLPSKTTRFVGPERFPGKWRQGASTRGVKSQELSRTSICGLTQEVKARLRLAYPRSIAKRPTWQFGWLTIWSNVAFGRPAL